MQNLNDGWYVRKHYKDENGDWHTKESQYMSKTEAEKYCTSYNAMTPIEEGTAHLMYDKDFDIEEE